MFSIALNDGLALRVYVLKSDGSFVDDSYHFSNILRYPGSHEIQSIELNKPLENGHGGFVRVALSNNETHETDVLDSHAQAVITDVELGVANRDKEWQNSDK